MSYRDIFIAACAALLLSQQSPPLRSDVLPPTPTVATIEFYSTNPDDYGAVSHIAEAAGVYTLTAPIQRVGAIYANVNGDRLTIIFEDSGKFQAIQEAAESQGYYLEYADIGLLSVGSSK